MIPSGNCSGGSFPGDIRHIVSGGQGALSNPARAAQGYDLARSKVTKQLFQLSLTVFKMLDRWGTQQGFAGGGDPYAVEVNAAPYVGIVTKNANLWPVNSG